MSFLHRWFGTTAVDELEVPSAALLSEDERNKLNKLLAELSDEYNIEGRIQAAEQLGAATQFGDIDVAAALAAAAARAARQFEAKRMTIAMMHGIRPDQIEVKPHVDDSRVTIAVVKVLRKLASRRDISAAKFRAALENLKSSIKTAEIRSRVGF